MINNNAWSLEIEVQFYLLVPIILRLLLWTPLARRATLIALAVLFSLHPAWLPARFPASLVQSFQYFAIGILFCDLWTNEFKTWPRSAWVDGLGLTAWPLFFWLNLTSSELACSVLNPWIIALLFMAALQGRWHSRILSWGFIPIIGGMCYSIYLFHARVVSLVLHYGFGPFGLTHNFTLDFVLLCAGVFPVVLLVCGAFFILVEKPCMNPNWVRNLLSKARCVAAKPTEVFKSSNTPI